MSDTSYKLTRIDGCGDGSPQVGLEKFNLEKKFRSVGEPRSGGDKGYGRGRGSGRRGEEPGDVVGLDGLGGEVYRELVVCNLKLAEQVKQLNHRVNLEELKAKKLTMRIKQLESKISRFFQFF